MIGLLRRIFLFIGDRKNIPPEADDFFDIEANPRIINHHQSKPSTPTLTHHLPQILHPPGKMTIWDSITGRKPTSQPSNSDSNSSQPTTTQNDIRSQAPFDPTEAQDVSSFLKGPDLYDPAQLHPLAGLNQETLDYLSLEDAALSDLPGAQSALPTRGWSDDLCYGTGVSYVTALGLGGAWGLQEGLRRSAGQAPKLRLNSVLNSITRRGPFLGNSAGVIALVYNGFNSYIGHLRGKHDSANSIVAGALSGMLFKSTRGLKPMAISGGIVASVAGTWAVCLICFFSGKFLVPN